MRLVHLADTHLGYRQYNRLSANGVNQREVDVCDTFGRVVDQIIALAPEVVVIAGDIFHSPRPTNYAMKRAFAGFGRLVESLPATIVVAVSGNHDLPRGADLGGSMLPLFDHLGIHIVEYQARRLTFRDRDLSILGVPDAPCQTRPVLAPDPSARYNVLAIHGEAAGAMPREMSMADPAAIREISADELSAPSWSYVAFGHYHVMTELAPNAFYSGSIDYTSTDVWGELRQEAEKGLPGKGFIERDLESGAQTFHPIAVSRLHVDLPPIDARGLTAEDLTARIAAAVDECPGGIDGAIARLVITECPIEVSRSIDHRVIRSAKLRALGFGVTIRRPEPVLSPPMAQAFIAGAMNAAMGQVATRAQVRMRSLRTTVGEKLDAHELSPGVDRDEFKRTAMEYFDRADAEILEKASTAEPATVTELFTEPQARAS